MKLTDAELNIWIAEHFRRSNPRAWHESPDFCNDNVMTMLLIRHKSFVSLDLMLNGHYRAAFDDGTNFQYATDENPGRAVAEAWALANGWKEG